MVLTASTPIIDVTGARGGRAPRPRPGARVVIPGTRPKQFPAGEYQRAVRADHRPAHRVDRPQDLAQRRAARLSALPCERRPIAGALAARRCSSSATSLERHRRRGALIADLVEARAAASARRRARSAAATRVVGPHAARDRRRAIALVGHLDTVPTVARRHRRACEGDRIVGRGAADMKGGLAVMLRLLERVADQPRPATSRSSSTTARRARTTRTASTPVLGRPAPARGPTFAVVLEPTDNTRARRLRRDDPRRRRLPRQAAHSARPWQGENAIYKAARRCSAGSPRRAERAGRRRRASSSTTRSRVTLAHGGASRNVVPDEFRLGGERPLRAGPRPRRSARPRSRRWRRRARSSGSTCRRRRVPNVTHPAVRAFIERDRRRGASEAGLDRRRDAAGGRHPGRSTSAPARRRRRTSATSGSRSPRWSTASSVLADYLGR